MKVTLGTCADCTENDTLLFDGYCAECSPAPGAAIRDAYAAWYGTPAAWVETTIEEMFESDEGQEFLDTLPF